MLKRDAYNWIHEFFFSIKSLDDVSYDSCIVLYNMYMHTYMYVGGKTAAPMP